MKCRFVIPCAAFFLAAGAACAMPGAMPWDHAGGEGRPDCTACHFDREAVTQSAALRLSGLPERVEPGVVYELVLRLETETLRRAGFLMHAESPDEGRAGEPAGRFLTGDDRTETDGGAIRSTEAGASPVQAGEGEWRFSWRAPDGFTGPVRFYIAAVAANDDSSPLGDRVHLLQKESVVKSESQ